MPLGSDRDVVGRRCSLHRLFRSLEANLLTDSKQVGESAKKIVSVALALLRYVSQAVC